MDALFAKLKRVLDSEARHQRAPARPPEAREAAVLAPLFLKGNEPHVLITKRTAHLRKHAGQLSFPGGARDTADSSLLHTALRETHEEVGIPLEHIDVLAPLTPMATFTGYYIHPFVGVLRQPFQLAINSEEIDRVYEVPLRELRHVQRPIAFGMRDAYEWGAEPDVIWGATWYMLRELLSHLQKAEGR